MKESVRTNAIETRGLLISKRWVQAVAIVMLFGFFVLGLLAYRTYTDQAPIPGKVVRPGGQVLFTRADVIAGQEIFLRNGLMEYRLHLRPRRLPRTRFHGGLPAPLGGLCRRPRPRLWLRIRES